MKPFAVAFLMGSTEIVDLDFGLIHQNISVKQDLISLTNISRCDEMLIFMEKRILSN